MSLLLRRGSAAPCKSSALSKPSDPALSLKRKAPEVASVPKRPLRPADNQLLIEKHAPVSSAALAVHKAKQQELRTWLTRADVALQLGLRPMPTLLVISGPTGAGKSTSLRVIANELGFELCEWVEGRTQRY
eukprot:6172214-Pleurochrysis_carterae.AAC.1